MIRTSSGIKDLATPAIAPDNVIIAKTCSTLITSSSQTVSPTSTANIAPNMKRKNLATTIINFEF